MNNARQKCGIPVCVKLRAYIPHILIILTVFSAYTLLFAFIAGRSVRTLAELRRINDAPHNEIIFAGKENGRESFIYLKNYGVSGETGENALSDILMVIPGRSYSENDVYFTGELEAGTCAVSANIAARYGLSEGQTARVMGTDKTFTVSRVITAQAGIDSDYRHEGIIILSYDGELLGRDYLFVSFDTDADAYASLARLVRINTLKEKNRNGLIMYGAVALAALALTMALCEMFLFSRRIRDYAVMASLGERSGALCARALFDNTLKYTVPAALVCLVYGGAYSCYGEVYTVIAVCFISAGFFASAIYSFFNVRRLLKCHIRTKRS